MSNTQIENNNNNMYCFNAETFCERSRTLRIITEYADTHESHNQSCQVIMLTCRRITGNALDKEREGVPLKTHSEKVAVYLTGFMPYIYLEPTLITGDQEENDITVMSTLEECCSNGERHIRYMCKHEKKRGFVGNQVPRILTKVSFYAEWERKFVVNKLLEKNTCKIYNSAADVLLQFREETGIGACVFIDVTKKAVTLKPHMMSTTVDRELVAHYTSVTQGLFEREEKCNMPWLSLCCFDIETHYIKRNNAHLSKKQKLDGVTNECNLNQRNLSIEVEGESELPKYMQDKRSVSKKRKSVSRTECNEMSFPVIQVGLISYHWNPMSNEFISLENIIYTVGQTGPIEDRDGLRNVKSRSFVNEHDMLKNVCLYMRRMNFDIIAGHNIANFDMFEIIQRMKANDISTSIYGWTKVSHAPFFKSLTNYSSDMKCDFPYGMKKGEKEIQCFGNIFLDTYRYTKTNYFSEASYKLGELCAKYCDGNIKDDVAYSDIDILQRTQGGRNKLARYCLRDCELVKQLLSKLSIVQSVLVMCKVTRLDPPSVLWKGQQAKIFSIFYHTASAEGVVIEHSRQSYDKDIVDMPLTGGLVLSPDPGCYRVPIAVLDFNSLYPSIICAFNICSSTEISKETIIERNYVEKEDFVAIDTQMGVLYFLTKKHAVSILARMEDEGIKRREDIKKELAKATADGQPKSVLNLLSVKEMQQKISNNSIYGFTGVKGSRLMPCQTKKVAAAITNKGRDVLKQAIDIVIGAKKRVVYGDTDSVFYTEENVHSIHDLYGCWFGNLFPEDDTEDKRRQRVMQRQIIEGIELSALISKELELKMVLEKLLFAAILSKKKKYIAGYYSSYLMKDYDLIKGVEAKRRDQCPFATEALKEIYAYIIQDKMVESTMVALRTSIKLHKGEFKMSDFSLSKSWNKVEYKNRPLHVAVAEAQASRNDPSAPAFGDRVEYVNVFHLSGVKNKLFAENPIEVNHKHLVADLTRPFEVYFARPVNRIMTAVFPDHNITRFFLFDYPYIMTRTRFESALSDGHWPLIGTSKVTQCDSTSKDTCSLYSDETIKKGNPIYSITQKTFMNNPFSPQLRSDNSWVNCVRTFFSNWNHYISNGGHMSVQYKIMSSNT